MKIEFHSIFRDSRALEVQNSILSLIVGLVFLADTVFRQNLYQRFPDTYRYMEWAPSWVWGWVYITAGFMHLSLVVMDSQREIRRQILLAKAGLWAFLSTCVLLSDRFAFAGWFYCVFAISAAYTFTHLKFHAGDKTNDNRQYHDSLS